MHSVSETVSKRLDENFFRVRFDRLTPGEKRFLRAMAELGPGAQRSSEVTEAFMPLSRRWAHGPRNAGFWGSLPARRRIVRMESRHWIAQSTQSYAAQSPLGSRPAQRGLLGLSSGKANGRRFSVAMSVGPVQVGEDWFRDETSQNHPNRHAWGAALHAGSPSPS